MEEVKPVQPEGAQGAGANWMGETLGTPSIPRDSGRAQTSEGTSERSALANQTIIKRASG